MLDPCDWYYWINYWIIIAYWILWNLVESYGIVFIDYYDWHDLNKFTPPKKSPLTAKGDRCTSRGSTVTGHRTGLEDSSPDTKLSAPLADQKDHEQVVVTGNGSQWFSSFFDVCLCFFQILNVFHMPPRYFTHRPFRVLYCNESAPRLCSISRFAGWSQTIFIFFHWFDMIWSYLFNCLIISFIFSRYFLLKKAGLRHRHRWCKALEPAEASNLEDLRQLIASGSRAVHCCDAELGFQQQALAEVLEGSSLEARSKMPTTFQNDYCLICIQ